MSTANPFDLLGDDDAEDPALLVAAQQPKAEPKKVSGANVKTAAQSKLPSKPIPPAQAVKEAKSDSARGVRRGGGREYGQDRGAGGGRDYGQDRGAGGGRDYGQDRGAGVGSYKDPSHSDSRGNSVERRKALDRKAFDTEGFVDKSEGRKTFELKDGWYQGYREPAGGGRRGGNNNGERSNRQYDRHSANGKANGMKREGSGQGNWGTHTDELALVVEADVVEGEKGLNAEKPSVEERVLTEEERKEAEEREREAKEMTLEEYEKILEEKRKALQTLKSEGRKVDKTEFESMQELSNKKSNDDIFIKLGSDKDKKKEVADKEERAKKSISINEFLKPAEGERYFGRGRGGRGRGARGDYGGGRINVSAPIIEDHGQFPTLAAK